MNSSSPSTPEANSTPTMKPITMTGSVSAITSVKSATVRPSSRARRLTGVSAKRSKYPVWMSVTKVTAREMPVTAKMMATGSWNAL